MKTLYLTALLAAALSAQTPPAPVVKPVAPVAIAKDSVLQLTVYVERQQKIQAQLQALRMQYEGVVTQLQADLEKTKIAATDLQDSIYKAAKVNKGEFVIDLDKGEFVKKPLDPPQK